MTAYRMETVQVNTPLGPDGGEQTDSVSTSTVVMGGGELDDCFDAEATLHQAAGWRVRRIGRTVVAAKVRDSDLTLVVRVIYAVGFDPADDGDPGIAMWPVLS